MNEAHFTTHRSKNYDDVSSLPVLEVSRAPTIEKTAQELIFEIISKDSSRPTLEVLDNLLLKLEREWALVEKGKANLEHFEIALNSLESLFMINRLRTLEETPLSSETQPTVPSREPFARTLVFAEEHPALASKSREDILDYSISQFILMIRRGSFNPDRLDLTPLLQELEELWNSRNLSSAGAGAGAGGSTCSITKFKSILTLLIELYTLLESPFPKKLSQIFEEMSRISDSPLREISKQEVVTVGNSPAEFEPEEDHLESSIVSFIATLTEKTATSQRRDPTHFLREFIELWNSRGPFSASDEKCPISKLESILTLLIESYSLLGIALPEELSQIVEGLSTSSASHPNEGTREELSVEEPFPPELKNREDNLDQAIVDFMRRIVEETIDPKTINPTPLLEELEKLWRSYDSSTGEECPITKFHSIVDSLMELYTLLKSPHPKKLTELKQAIRSSNRK